MTKDESLKLALEGAANYIDVLGGDSRKYRQALAQPEQEPVSLYVYKPTLPRGHLKNVSDGDLPWVYDQDPSSGYTARMLVYTTPPQRTWVGLTDEEMQALWDRYAHMEMMRAIEAKLKEKNFD